MCSLRQLGNCLTLQQDRFSQYSQAFSWPMQRALIANFTDNGLSFQLIVEIYDNEDLCKQCDSVRFP